jgi:hypothetical protein
MSVGETWGDRERQVKSDPTKVQLADGRPIRHVASY